MAPSWIRRVSEKPVAREQGQKEPAGLGEEWGPAAEAKGD